MKNSVNVLALVGVLFVAAQAHTAAEQKASTFVLCKNQKTVRTIRITPEQTASKDCRVTYSKVGVDEVIGSSRSMDDCKSILKNVQENLESSKWNCRTVEKASISYSSEVSVQ